MIDAVARGINNVFRGFFAAIVKPVVFILYPYRENVVVRNSANIISTARLVTCLYVDWLVATAPNQDVLHGYLWVVFFLVLSDGIDGALARGLKVESRYGERVDPLADKLLVGGLLIGLCYRFQNFEYTALAATIIMIEVLNVIFGQKLMNLAYSLGREAGSTIWGKLKFGDECILVFASWLIADVALAIKVSTFLTVTAILLAVMSFADYRHRVRQFEAEIAAKTD